MSWLNFLTLIFALYGIYYGVLLFSDTIHGGKRAEADGPEQLHFVETPAPEKVDSEDIEPFAAGTVPSATAAPASIGLGGVSLKDIFELSRTKALQYTRPVSF